MKICYLSSARIPDDWGHVLQIMQMCEAFAQNGHEVTLLVPRRGKTLKQDPYAYAGVAPIFKIQRLVCIDFFPGTTSLFFYVLRTLSFYLSVKFYLLRQSFDLFYTREPLVTLFIFGCVYEIHSPPKDSSRTRRALLRTRGLVALTSSIKNILVQRGYPEDRIIVEHDAVKAEKFQTGYTKTQARTKCAIPEDQYVIGYVGTLKTMGMEKGVACTIRALLELPDNVHFWVVGGEANDIAEYAKLATDLGVHDRVHLVGKVPHAQVSEYLAAFDVVVAPFPDFEHYRLYMSPLKIFEYMVAKVPMVVSDLPSLRDVLDERTAVLIPPAGEHALATAIQEFQANPSRAANIANAAYELVISHYSWRARAERIMSFANSL
ncbi:MAG TPA: glycosyltransferase family 4 protein [Candidatus Paceibacterota bacterium]|nr:glycosyltransferase family 4 protein [Candidatus Paceibacterota bacterium]